MTTRLPPHGRAPGIRRDDRIDAEESLATRARELPPRDTWIVSLLGIDSAVGDRTGLTANRLRLYHLGKFEALTTLSQARVNVTTPSAGATVRTAIYAYVNDDGQRRLVKIAASEAVFDAAAIGRKTADLPHGAELAVGRYFLGVKASDNTLGLAGMAAVSFDRQTPVYTYSDGAGALPASLQLAQLTKDYATALLDVLYMSPDAAQVL